MNYTIQRLDDEHWATIDEEGTICHITTIKEYAIWHVLFFMHKL